MWLGSRARVAGEWTGHHLRWWMALYQPPVPSDANIYYNLIWAAIYLSCTWSIKMNRTVVRIDCNFLSFSSTKVHFWHEDNILSVLLLHFLKLQFDWSAALVCIPRGFNSFVGLGYQKAICLLRYFNFRLRHTFLSVPLTRFFCPLKYTPVTKALLPCLV